MALQELRRDFVNKLAKLYRRSLFEEDKENELATLDLEARIRDRFPREHKRLEAVALNVALGQYSKGPQI